MFLLFSRISCIQRNTNSKSSGLMDGLSSSITGSNTCACEAQSIPQGTYKVVDVRLVVLVLLFCLRGVKKY